ncbi:MULTISPECIES: SDR family oxidoreductase [Thermomonospora]|uniref:Short-chain dehydrogenase/reductase SDR n=1 Tax=Thermomonospora curvata (strain ATCC 19995 / DSM 43183 / JCM 3096 / KCTC 9072 / NBRC 15933 / NCIMB 10081 / Henssen B9) TaxID=471852 RepID=D1A4W8_THECD|nr:MULTISPECIES: SDR family oxidoreductase [Thermomonospora]ACY98137.1 short-chain dehydrogenase/reductase SDR [Thermomonospora curvata DSM 43183]PKK13908.1 MAG: short-chain dehydrogenase [Thermomonospora sp. CIF 1]
MRFADRVAIVTGAGQGIGEAYAKALAAEGAKVVVADLNGEQAERVAKEIAATGGTARAVVVDVADPASAQAMADAAVAAYGGIDYLVNNAAIYGGMQIESLMKVDLGYYRRFMAVNMDGALHCTRAVHKAMRERGGGAIVNQSSTAAWMAGGFYSIAKAALNSLTVNLAAELGWMGIRVNAIAPGPTDTAATRRVVPAELIDPMVQGLMIKRMGTPADHVGALKFLLSDEASWVTGQIIAVDGGHIVRL